MYSKIPVTLDGSKTPEAIIPEIERTAGPASIVTLLTVAAIPSSLALNVRPPVVVGAPAAGGVVKVPGPMAETRGQAISRVQDELTRYLESVAKPLRKLGLHVETRVAFGGDAGEQILKAAIGIFYVSLALVGAAGVYILGYVMTQSAPSASTFGRRREPCANCQLELTGVP